ncbi:hypothetical protein LTR67_001615 [Exophiala xenobiotica]
MHLISSANTLRLVWAASTVLSTASAFRAASTAADTLSLLTRRDDLSCSAVDSKLPSNFKCASGSTCISLDNSSSGLCCPDNNDCSNIQTVSCNIQTQNITANTNAPIFTTRLGDKLPTCGDNACCPFGYQCILSPDGNNVCNIIASTSKNGTSSSSSSSSSTASSTSTSSSTATSKPLSTSLTSSAAQTSTCNKFPVGVFLAGFFPGMFIGAFLMLAWVICSGRHRKPNGSSRSSTGSGSSVYKPTISDPIPLGSPSGGLRTDFLRRTTGRAKSIFSTKSQIPSGSTSASHWKMPTPPVPNNIPASTTGAAQPVTPERRLAHELSSENIRVFSPPSGTGVMMQPVPAHIAPLRGMSAQRYNHNGNATNPGGADSMGSPFQSPPKGTSFSTDHAHSNAEGLAQTNARGMSTYSAVSSLGGHEYDHQPETLTPARYEPAGWTPTVTKRVRPEGVGELESRPTTTFTEMLHEAGFPDPMNEYGTPAVPKIPDTYGSGRKW